MNFTINLKDLATEYSCSHKDTKDFVYLYHGWIHEGDIEDYFSNITDCNGEFFLVAIDKNNKQVTVYNDRRGSYMIYYSHDMISTDLKKFKKPLDDDWFASCYTAGRSPIYLKQCLDYSAWREMPYSLNNCYAKYDVKFLPQGCSITHKNDAIHLHHYHNYYINIFNDTVKYKDFDELVETVQNRLTKNIKQILATEKTKPLVCGSTGIDSLTVLSLMQDKKYDFLNYYFEDSKESYSCYQNAKKLMNYHNTKKIKHLTKHYDTSILCDDLFKNKDIINHYNFGHDVLYDVLAVKDKYPNKKLVIKGTWGDECFYHDEHAYLLYLKDKNYSFKDARAYIKDMYCFLGESPLKLDEDTYNKCNSGWRKEMIAYYYYKTPSYFTSDRTYSQTKTFSPFADEYLINLPLKCCDEVALRCINGELQKKLITDDLYKICNTHKDGEQTIKQYKWKTYNFKKFYSALDAECLRQLNVNEFIKQNSYQSFTKMILLLFYANLKNSY